MGSPLITRTLLVTLGLVLGTFSAATREETKEPQSKSEAGAGFPEDKGPDVIDVSSYTAEHQANYKIFAKKCSWCHTLARPINSEYLELSEEEQEKAARQDPEIFKDSGIVFVERDVWRRYVKRMMGKPGCPVKGNDGKNIWEFLVYDSKIRKTGPNAAAWRERRKKLLEDFNKPTPLSPRTP